VLCWFSSSPKCQQSHWNSGHKEKCKSNSGANGFNSAPNGATNGGFKASAAGGKGSNLIALVPSGYGTSRPIKKPKDVIFFYCCFDDLFLCFIIPCCRRRSASLRC